MDTSVKQYVHQVENMVDSGRREAFRYLDHE